MRVVLRPLPVLYACAGKSVPGAREVAAALDRRGLAESASVAGPRDDLVGSLTRARSRYPIFVLDGCANACARRFLEDHGVSVEQHCVLTDFGVEKQAACLGAEVAEQVADRIAGTLVGMAARHKTPD